MKVKKPNFLSIGLVSANLMILLMLSLWMSQSTALKDQNEMLSKIDRATSQRGLETKAVAAGMPDKKCHNLATQKDNATKNATTFYRKCSEEGDPYYPDCLNRLNPCTLKTGDSWSMYSNSGDNMAITNLRTEYGSGDAEGYMGATRYLVCQDGRASVIQRIYGPIYSWNAWGFWFNFPFDDNPATGVKDKIICDTLD